MPHIVQTVDRWKLDVMRLTPGESLSKMGKEEGNTFESRKFPDCTMCFVWINKWKIVSFEKKLAATCSWGKNVRCHIQEKDMLEQ